MSKNLKINAMLLRRSGSSKRGFCECPRGAAFNATSCQCQKAELCPRESPKPALIGEFRNSIINGIKCAKI